MLPEDNAVHDRKSVLIVKIFRTYGHGGADDHGSGEKAQASDADHALCLPVRRLLVANGTSCRRCLLNTGAKDAHVFRSRVSSVREWCRFCGC